MASLFFQGRLIYSMLGFAEAFELGMLIETQRKADEIQQYARDNAPWDDISGEARAGLTAEVVRELFVTYIVLYHTVDYGIWLEIRWDGRFAIIEPTLEKFGPETMGGLSFQRILSGH